MPPGCSKNYDNLSAGSPFEVIVILSLKQCHSNNVAVHDSQFHLPTLHRHKVHTVKGLWILKISRKLSVILYQGLVLVVCPVLLIFILSSRSRKYE